MKKFGAKKITALAAALAVVTVGGVYATWSFANDDSITQTHSFSLALEESVTTAGEGTYSIGDNITKYLSVDQANANHNPKLVLNNPIIIKFTPNAGATSDVQNYGLKSTFAFSVVNMGQYESTDVFSITTTTVTIYPTNAEAAEVGSNAKWAHSEEGYFYIILAQDDVDTVYDIDTYITINSDYEIDTTAKYTAYETALDSCSIRLTVDEYSDTSAN